MSKPNEKTNDQIKMNSEQPITVLKPSDINAVDYTNGKLIEESLLCVPFDCVRIKTPQLLLNILPTSTTMVEGEIIEQKNVGTESPSHVVIKLLAITWITIETRLLFVAEQLADDHPSDCRVILGLLSEMSKNITNLQFDAQKSNEENILTHVQTFETAILHGVTLLQTLKNSNSSEHPNDDLLKGTILETSTSDEELWSHYDLNKYFDEHIEILPNKDDDVDELINNINKNRVDVPDESPPIVDVEPIIEERFNLLRDKFKSAKEMVTFDKNMKKLCSELKNKVSITDDQEQSDSKNPYYIDPEAEEIQADEGDTSPSQTNSTGQPKHDSSQNSIPTLDGDMYDLLLKQNEAKLATVVSKISDECYPMLETKIMAQLHGRDKREIIPSFNGVKKSLIYYLHLLKRVNSAVEHASTSDTSVNTNIKHAIKKVERQVSEKVQELDNDKSIKNQTARFINHLERGTLNLITIAMTIIVTNSDIEMENWTTNQSNTYDLESSKSTWKQNGLIQHYTERHELYKQCDGVDENTIKQCETYNKNRSTYI